MSAADNGGPAFPHVGMGFDHIAGKRVLQVVEPGITLRDYFAAKAMHAHLITDTVPGPACDALLEAAANAGREPLDHLAFNAYEVADAMLKARQA